MDVSRRKRLLNEALEGQLPCVLLHKVFEAFKCNNFPEGDVNGFGSRFHPKDLGRLVGKASIESNRSDCDSHSGRLLIYTLFHFCIYGAMIILCKAELQ